MSVARSRSDSMSMPLTRRTTGASTLSLITSCRASSEEVVYLFYRVEGFLPDAALYIVERADEGLHLGVRKQRRVYARAPPPRRAAVRRASRRSQRRRRSSRLSSSESGTTPRSRRTSRLTPSGMSARIFSGFTSKSFIERADILFRRRPVLFRCVAGLRRVDEPLRVRAFRA